MKKLYIGIGVVLVVVGAVWGLPKLRLSNPWLDGKWEEVERGDMEIPVSASGTVVGEALVEIKPKANGEVTTIRVKEGMMVRKGDELVIIDPVDETRNLERAQAELDRIEATCRQAEIRLQDMKLNRPLDIEMAKARVAQADAAFRQAALEVDKLSVVTDKTEIEVKRARANVDSAKAQLDQAKVDLERAKVALTTQIPNAEQDLKGTKATYDSAVKTVDETKLRLKETKVLSPIDGMVYSILIAGGNIVQSGKTSFMGGTVALKLYDVSKMYVVAKVDEADIGSVRKIAPRFARPGETRVVSDEELMAYGAHAPASAPADAAASRQAADAEAALVGQRVHVTVEAYRDESYEGVIERILPEPQMLSNVVTFDVRIRLIGNDLQKLLGLQADVRFTSDRVTNVLKVKNESLVSEGKEVFVYVPFRENQNAPWFEKKVAVQIGLTDGTYTHIREGLNKGDRVWVKRPQRTDKEEKDQKS